MSFTIILDGDDGLATPIMDNFIWAGRMGLSSFYPMNAAGAYAVQNLGETGKEWGDIYLAAAKKIYVGGVEFKGGSGGGAGLETLEMKSHLEKQGITYPLSSELSLNESFINTNNITITPRVTYASGTTFVADYNKTDIDLMNATTGWADAGTAGGAATISQDTINKIEGTGSVKFTRASANGEVGMVKTFTAFSVIDTLLNFSFYIDTVSNLTRVSVTIASSGGNGKAYYIPVANISAAAWNHISIDPTNDTADATAGTFVPSAVTLIFFTYTTSNAQTVNCSVDFIVTQPNWILPLPYSFYIWDGTNQERLEIASVAGTGIHQRRTYTITALANGYAVSAAYAKERNVTISGNQGVFPAGLAGAAALAVYDQTTKFLDQVVTGKTLSMSQRFYDQEYKISTLSSTTVTKITVASDIKAYFKSGDKVILYHKRYTGRRYESIYNSTAANNFIIVTLTSDSTYSAPELTLTHTGEVNSGADTSYWYVVRYSAEMLYLLEAANAGGALSTLTPTIIIPCEQSVSYPTTLHSHWKLNEISGNAINSKQSSGGYNMTMGGTVPSSGGKINGGLARGVFSTSNYFQWDAGGSTATIYDSKTYWVDGWFKTSVTGVFQHIIGKVAQDHNTYADGWSVYISNANKLCLEQADGTNVVSASTYTDGLWHYFFCQNRATSGANESRIYVDGSLVAQGNGSSASNTTINLIIGCGHDSGTTFRDPFQGLLQSIAYGSVPMSWTDAEILIAQRYNSGFGREYGNDTGFIVRGTVDNLSGAKLTTGTKLTRSDSTNQNPIIFQRDAILS